MADTVTVSHQQAWVDAYYIVSQQMKSRFEQYTRDDGEVVGKWAWFDILGTNEMEKRTSRNQDTFIADVPHSRRGCPLADYELGKLIDPRDLHKLNNPQNAYARGTVMSANRNKDRVILAAVNGTAVSADEDDAQTSNALPAAQKVAVGGTGLTYAKLVSAREILRAAEAKMPEDEELLPFALSARQMTDLLKITEFKSRDFGYPVSIRDGKVEAAMGFRFIETELLGVDGSSNRLCRTWKPSSVGFRGPSDISEQNLSVKERADKGNAIQVYGDQTLGAVRVEDVGAVEIACSES